jgi:molecular chaperone DnaK
VLTGDVKELVLLDVLPLSLGIETRGGLFTKIIDRNSTIPLKKSLTFTTVADNQTSVEIHVLQGEREIAKANRSLAKFELVGIQPAPRGTPQIAVAFDVDSDGIVNVSARDKMTGREQAIKVVPSSGLSPEEIERLIEEAKRSGDADKLAKEVIQAHNRLDGLVQSTRRSFSEFGWMLPKEQQDKSRETLAQAEFALGSEELDTINKAFDELEASGRLLTEAMFSSAARDSRSA